MHAVARLLSRYSNSEAVAGVLEDLSLDGITALCTALGDPHLDYPAIHVTGTNGKGSTVAMATRLLVASGLRVGSYTSPHLQDHSERFRLDGEPVALDELHEAVTQVVATADALDIEFSQFEIMTGTAFLLFSNWAVDVAVVEVGLLGLVDATNVVAGTVAVLTNVGTDHGAGADRVALRRAIAEEKVGIVKDGATFVCGEQDPELRDLLAATPAAQTWWRGTDFDCDQHLLAVGGRSLTLRTPGRRYDEVHLPLHGAHQSDNASIALAAVEAFFAKPLDDDLVREGFAEVTVPGRFEVVHREPTVVLDAAHNVAGALACAETLRDEFALTGTLIIVAGFLDGRDPVEMLEALGASEAGFLIACTPESPRALPSSELAAAASSLGIVAESVPSVEHALSRALGLAGHDDFILVTGSLYVAGPARSYLRTEVEST